MGRQRQCEGDGDERVRQHEQARERDGAAGAHFAADDALGIFWEEPGRRDAQQPLKAWFREASAADWANPSEVKAAFRSASIVRNSRVIFNVAGNKYRLVVRINYPYRIIYVRFVGTHKEYDAIDVEEV